MYEAHYGLAELPFRIAPDPRFYVDAAPHRAVIRALLDRIGRGEDFTPLVGDFGTGKTTVARRMLEEAAPERHVVAELSHVRVEGDELLDRIAEALGLRRPKAAPPMGALLPQLAALARDGRDAWLLVDEADTLSVGALNRLRKLCAVRVDGRAPLHVFLVGRSTPAALDELQRVGRPLNVGAIVRMPALDAAGTHHYIHDRLRRSGWTGNPVFDPRTTAEIHARCQGTPGRINRLCGRILLHQFMQGRRDIDVGVVCAVDELLQDELNGETSGISLPAFEPVIPSVPAAPPVPVAPPVLTARVKDLDLDIEVPPPAVPVLERALAHVPAPAPASPPAPAAPLVPVRRAVDRRRPARRAKPVPARRPDLLERSGLARTVAVVLLMFSGGLLWHTISRVANHYSTQAQFVAAEAAFARREQAQAAAGAASAVVAADAPAAASPPAVQAASLVPPSATTSLLVAADQALAQSPPGAGPAPTAAHAGPVDAEPAASAAAHDVHAKRTVNPHRTRTASAIKPPARQPAAAAACSGDSPCMPVSPQ